MKGWITLSRIKWVFERFKKETKPRFVLEQNGACYVIYTDEHSGRIVLSMTEEELDKYLDAHQREDHKTINKLVNKHRIDEKKLNM